MTQLREVPLPLELRYFLEVGGLFAPLGKIFPIFSTLRQCSTNSARRNILKLFISFVSLEIFPRFTRNHSLAIKSEKSFSLCAFDIYPFKQVLKQCFIFSAPLCQDKHDQCSDHVSYCGSYDHVRKQCPRTCNQCGMLFLSRSVIKIMHA